MMQCIFSSDFCYEKLRTIPSQKEGDLLKLKKTKRKIKTNWLTVFFSNSFISKGLHL